METTEWDWPTAHQQHDLGETADVLWPSVRPNQRARIGPHPPAVDVASSNFIGIRNPSGSSTYFAINLYPQSGRLFAFLSYFDFDKVANCKEVNRILNGLANETFSVPGQFLKEVLGAWENVYARPCRPARRLGLPELVQQRLDLGNAPGRANTGDKMTGLPVARHTGESGYYEWGRKGWE